MKKLKITESQAKFIKENMDSVNNNFSKSFKKEPSRSFKPNMNDNKGKKFNPLAENEEVVETDNKFGKQMIIVLKALIKDNVNFELPKFFEKYNLNKDVFLNLLKSNHIINDNLQVYKNNLVDNVKKLYIELNSNHVQKKKVVAMAETENGGGTHTTDPISPNYKPLDIVHYNNEICILKDDANKLFVYYYFDKSKDDFAPYAAIDYTYRGKNSIDSEPEYDYDEWNIDGDVLNRYVNDNLQVLTKGRGLKGFEAGKDLVLLDDVLKQELISLYNKDKGLVKALSTVNEDTSAASSGSFSTPLGTNVIKRDIVSEFDNEGPQPGDSEYHNEFSREKEASGLSKFEDIDWEMIHQILMNNTKEILLKQPINDITYSVNNFAEVGVSREDIRVLEYYDIIYIQSGIPVFEYDKYYDLNNFQQDAKKAWDSISKLDEVTDSSSSGQYSQPAIWAKDPNNARFSHKPMYPKGKIVKVTESFIYNQISKKLNKSVEQVKQIVKEQKLQLKQLPKLFKLVENGGDLKTQTTYKNGEMVGFDSCTKLNNNKEAEKGGCSVGAVDKVAKGTKTKDSMLKENTQLSPQQIEQLNRLNKMSLEEFIGFLNRWDINPENMQPQFIQSNWGDKITYDPNNGRWIPVSDSEAQGGLAMNALDRAENLSEDNTIYEQVAKKTGKTIEEVKKIIAKIK